MVESWPPTVGHFSGSIKCDSKVPFYHLTPNFAIVDLRMGIRMFMSYFKIHMNHLDKLDCLSAIIQNTKFDWDLDCNLIYPNKKVCDFKNTTLTHFLFFGWTLMA